jgi:nitrite reductase (NADH) small subunit
MTLSANSLAKVNASWIAVARIDEITPGQGRCFAVGSRKIALFRSRDGKLYALDAECPHRNGPLAEGVIGCETVICPLHGYKFSLVDGRGFDSNLSVTSYAAEIRNHRIYVKLPL